MAVSFKHFITLTLLLSFTFLTGPACHATSDPIDSLKRLAASMPEDSVKCDLLIRIALALYSGPEAVSYSDSAVALSKKLEDDRLLARALSASAWCYPYDRMDKKTAFLDSATNLFTSLDDIGGLGAIWNTRAVILLEYGSMDEAAKSLEKSYDYFVKAKDAHRQAVALNNWAVTLLELDRVEEALEKYNLALEYRLTEQPLNDLELGRIYYGKGRCAVLMGDLSEALDHYIESYRFRKNIQNYAVAEVLIDLASTIYDLALVNKDTTLVIKRLQALGFEHSGSLLDSAMAIVSASGKTNFQDQMLEARRKRALVNKDYEAAYAVLMEQKEQDEKSKLSDASLEAFATLKSQYEQESLKLRLLEEELENQKKEDQVRYLLIFLGIMILVFIIGLLVYQNRLKEKHLELTQFKQEQQFIIMRSMLEGQEKERARIARDLHDGLGNLLSTVKVTVSSLGPNANGKDQNKLFNSANELIDDACQAVRKISHQMMPQALERLGLVKALEDLVATADRAHSFHAAFVVYGNEKRLDDNTNLMLFRIVQELLNNVIKYAQAYDVLVQLTFGEDWLNLTVEDDGVGFDPNDEKIKQGLGLQSIAFRTEHLGGDYEIDSKPGRGTLITINLPLTSKSVLS